MGEHQLAQKKNNNHKELRVILQVEGNMFYEILPFTLITIIYT